ncbi:MAG: Ig-like domain-containing protein [Ignavibacteriales bacterium]|nr:Ig-like domain-containing protein [Ignavibacteriales bacterium]
MNFRNIPFLFLFSLLCIIAFRCAGIYPPSGGPPDTIPPAILETFPQPSTLNFSDNHFSISFSEYMNKQSVENAMFVSPSLGKLEYNWSGEEVDVSFSNPLKENTTYVITIGTDAADFRERNKLKETFSLAFSTGSAIDSGKISGKVFDDKPSGVMIFAYSNRNYSFDTLSPQKISPDYISQTGNDGTFTLDHLAKATYRLFAVRDDERNLLYDVSSNEIGVLTNDVFLEDSVKDVQFRLSKEDETKPFLLSANAVSSTEIELNFSEPIDTTRLANGKFQIINIQHRELIVRNIFPDIPSLKKIFLETQEQTLNELYNVIVSEIFDTSGNVINETQDTASFTSANPVDTIPPSIVSLSPIIADSIRGIELQPNILCVFNESINQKKIQTTFHLEDSTRKKVPFNLEMRTPRVVSISPNEKLKSVNWYTLSIILDSVEDKNGLHFNDSILVRHFKTVDEKDFGILKGKVIAGENDSAHYFVSVKNIERRNYIQQVEVNEKNEFEFDNLVQGKYVLSTFRDDDGNKKYSYGKSFPFHPSEIFTESSDTLKVRARWSVEGVQITIPRSR